MRRLALFALAAAACGVLAGCAQEPGRVYQKSPADAHKILGATGIPPGVFGTNQPDFSTDRSDPKKVTWTIKRGGVELFRYMASLTPESGGATRVNVTMTAPTQGPMGDINKKLNENPAIKKMYQAAMEERVASALEGRPFKLSAVYPEMMQAAFANLGNIQASVNEVHAAEMKKARDNIDKAYAEEAAGRRR
jgi:hypothetical protein